MTQINKSLDKAKDTVNALPDSLKKRMLTFINEELDTANAVLAVGEFSSPEFINAFKDVMVLQKITDIALTLPTVK